MKPIAELLEATALDANSPFTAPWEARAFAIAVGLSEAGICTWEEFRLHLIAEIGKADKARAHGWVEPGEGYFTHFLRALENLLREKGLVEADALATKMEEISAGDHHDHER